MQYEMKESACALCRSVFAPAADAYPGPSRLCSGCKQLVQTILPRAGFSPALEAAPQPVVTDEIEIAEESFDFAGQVDERQVDERIGAVEPSLFGAEEESYYKTDLEIQPDPHEVEDFVEDFPGAPHESMLEETVSGYSLEATSETWPQVTQIYGAQPASAHFPPLTAPLIEEAAQGNGHDGNGHDGHWAGNGEKASVEAFALDAAHVDTTSVRTAASAPLAEGYQDAVTDPWENPLPAWDYSHSEYPVLLGRGKRAEQRKFLLPVAAALLMVGLVVSYFLLTQPGSAERESQNPVAGETLDSTAPGAEQSSAESSSAEPSSADVAADQSASDQSAANQSAADQNEVTPQTGAEAATATAASEFGGVGSLTLQSAAFPDEAGANEFSQKLISAGIPAYVVPANINGKGRWFRVRVGRFSNTDDAKKYAAQSRMRARAAGMNADFIVVEYGKP